MGPFPRAISNRIFVIVATDYFTKWIETKVLAKYPRCECEKVCLEEHYSRFGVPKTQISNNGLQFDSKAF